MPGAYLKPNDMEIHHEKDHNNYLAETLVQTSKQEA
jgi:hypothetical protein